VVNGLVQTCSASSQSPPPSTTAPRRSLNSVLALYGFHFIINCTTTSPSTILHNTFILFVVILALHSVINVFSSHLVSLLNRISAWWMLGGVIAIVGILIFGPSTHQSASFVFSHRINNSGFSGHFYWFMILPLGFLLTMYTFTGYDASAHLSERDARRRARRPARAVDVDRPIRRSADGRCCSGSPRLAASASPSRGDQPPGRMAERILNHRVVRSASPSSLQARPRPSSTNADSLMLLLGWAASAGRRLAQCVIRRSLARRRRAGPCAVAKLNSTGTPTWRSSSWSSSRSSSRFRPCSATRPVSRWPSSRSPSITTIGLYIAYILPVFLRWRMG